MIQLFAVLLLASAPNPVVDDADVLKIMDETSLASKLASIETNDRVEIAIATFEKIPSGHTAYSHARSTIRTWDVGSRVGNRGVLIAFYEQDREVYIDYTGDVPYITDGNAKHVIDTYMIPAFKKGDVAGGLSTGAAEILATVRGNRIGAGATTKPTRRSSGIDGSDMVFAVIIGIVVIGVIIQMSNGSMGYGSSGYRRRNAFNPLWGSTSSRRSSSWGSSFGGGSRSSGGGGGFRGRGAGGKW